LAQRPPLGHNKGTSIREAILEAAQTRLIPIILTTATAIAGLVPLLITGNALWTPLSLVIIGGLTVSTGVTLVLAPVLYTLITRKKN